LAIIRAGHCRSAADSQASGIPRPFRRGAPPFRLFAPLLVALGLLPLGTQRIAPAQPPASESEIEDAPSPTENRLKRARGLIHRRDLQADGELLQLTLDPVPEVRRAALETMSQRPATARLRRRVEELAESDEDPLVRGHALLLAADWDAANPKAVAPADFRQPATPPAARSSRDATSPSRTTNRAPPYKSQLPRALQPAVPLLPDAGAGRPRSISDSAPRSRFIPFDAGSPIRRTSHEEGAAEIPIFELSDPAADREADGGDGEIDPLFAPRSAYDEPGFSGALHRLQPGILDRPFDETFREYPPAFELPDSLLVYDTDAPLGFTGPSGILPTEYQEDSHFAPVEDRWRLGFSEWDRYDKQHPWVDDYPYVEGHWWDPFNLNVLKGDYPIIGQHTFLNITGSAITFHEFRQLPTDTTPFESTVDPFQEEFFGNPNQYFNTTLFRLKFDLFHGNAAFKPVDWRVVLEPVFNMNYLHVNELGVVSPDVRQGTTRYRDFMALEQYFVEAKLADLSPDYDFLSARVGSQLFNSDFRGFIFTDINRGARLFGTRLANRDQFNVVLFDMLEKDTNSFLNTFDDRHQWVFIANYFRQDFLFPGYTAQVSFHYNHDQPSFLFDKNGFLARPDPAGVFQPHEVDAYYFGFAGDGHFDRINVSHAFYWVRGVDSMNPIAGRRIGIDAKMAAIEASYDRDWIRFRSSFFYASGDDDVTDGTGKGFDAILDNPNFIGGRFSFWQRQQIKLFGVNLTQRESLVPNLRSSKFQGQANFVNPGLILANFGMDFEVTPKTRFVTNASYLWFDKTQVLEQFTFQSDIKREIGTDVSVGVEYRPLLNDNIIFIGGYSALVPGRGFKDLFGVTDPFNLFNTKDITVPTMHSVFMELALTY
jgi:hypothetical protein